MLLLTLLLSKLLAFQSVGEVYQAYISHSSVPPFPPLSLQGTHLQAPCLGEGSLGRLNHAPKTSIPPSIRRPEHSGVVKTQWKNDRGVFVPRRHALLSVLERMIAGLRLRYALGAVC